MHDRDRDANIKARIRQVIEDCDKIGEEIRTIPRIDIDVPPCLSTPEGQDLFRSQLQPWRVVLRNGGWGLLWARLVCEVSYWLGRAMTALGLRAAWRLVRVR